MTNLSTDVTYPARLDLAQTPTPLMPLSRLSAELGVELYIKRDDLTGMVLSGNKVRKLEFVLAEALNQGADTVLTCGGEQSNHARSTAAAATQLGLKTRLILRTPDPAAPPAPAGNVLLNRILGADIVWITPEEYKNRDEIMAGEAEALRREGRRPYVIPVGASNALGAWGYIRAMEELARDLSRLSSGGPEVTTIVHAAGSGGTAAGVILGLKLWNLPARAVSINVCDDREYFIQAIGEICEQAIEDFGLALDFDREKDIEIIDGYVGAGYALSQPEELSLILEVARKEGIILDPVYTGKAFYGLISEIRKQTGRLGGRIVFLHTGGLFGLFPKIDQIIPLL